MKKGRFSVTGKRLDAIFSDADTSALAEHDKKVAERAWDEGERAGQRNGVNRIYAVMQGKPQFFTPNPYRSIEQTEGK